MEGGPSTAADSSAPWHSEDMTFDTSHVPFIEISPGVRMPQLGYGVFQVPADQTQRCVEDAIEVGYRHIDTASAYGNEAGVGAAIANCGVPREELFVVTKLRNADQGADLVRPAFEHSLELLGLDRVDLYLMHWPRPATGLYVESWRVMEDLFAAGLTRAIGVCNFLVDHLQTLLREGEVAPAVNQVESHPTFQQAELLARTRALGIAPEAYSPLGRAADLQAGAVIRIAQQHGATPAQVVLRWHLQRGVIAIPKTTHLARMAENLDLFEFQLSEAEINEINALESGARTGRDPASFEWDQIGTPPPLD